MGYTQAEVIGMSVALFVILVGGVILRQTLRHATAAIRQIPLMILGATILLLEIAKQSYHLIQGDWNPWFLPLHFCSFFLIWYAVALCTRGKVRQLMYFCSLSGGILVSLLLFIAPRMIIHAACSNLLTSFDAFHTYFFHMGVVAYWIWMLMLNVYQPQRQHIYQTIILHTIFYFFVIAGAHIFHENYTNVLNSDGIALLENIRLSAGQFVYTIVMLLIGIAAITLATTATYYVINKSYHQHANKIPVK
ncbi:MAG: YwaF family protein [Prevotella sp.]|nr:YwaF family protein [Prevotella sp.]